MKNNILYRGYLRLIVTFFLLTVAGVVTAHPGGAGSLKGRVVDADSGEPVGFAYLLIEEVHFWQRVNSDGSFHFDNIPPGAHSVKTYRLGYHETTARVIIRRDQLTEKTFRLAAAPLLFDEAVISAHRVHTDTTMENPDLVVADHRLRQNLGMTIAKTLENEPGLDQISMGPAPARPVLRGLGGDRLLVLEDGERTGDLSATSADHAVSIDPMTTTRIEVIRGPEALIYGANAMGGVINVRREAVPRAKPEQLTGSLTLQGTSVNDGAAGALEISAPIGPLTARGDISLRRAQDVQTPDGVLRNTGIQTKNGSLGLSLVQNWGFLGMAGGGYVSEYGIPPDPIGGHPNGVDIDMQRYHVTTESQFNISLKSVRHLFVKHTYSRYTHQEIEASGTLGMEFGVNTHNISAILHFCECGPLNNARIGFWGEYRDYASGGLTFTPDSKELTGAAYLYNEYITGPWSFNGTIRVDAKSVEPNGNYVSRQVGHIRQRQFAGISGAVSGHYHIQPDFMLGATALRTFRAPGVEELFSEGPHLAAYSYEVGNADLDNETGLGLELFSEYEFSNGTIRAAVFRNELQNYIFPRNTGERSWRRADLFLYQYSGLHALMVGFELSASWSPLSWLSFAGQVQHVRGDLVDADQPIPRMPPLSGSVEVRYHYGPLSVILDTKAAAAQGRVGQFEQPTAGFVIYDITTQYLLSGNKMLHTLSLTAENVSDVAYRRHLNRVKEIMPEPGRNIRLLYKVFF